MAQVFVKSAAGLSFAQVAAAISCYGANDDIDAECLAFVAKYSLNDQPVCWSATHSFGGRKVCFIEGVEPLFLKEYEWQYGGWYAVREGEANYMFASSASSGSSLEATLADDGTWGLILRVPVKEGVPYEGWYYEKYHAVLEGINLWNFVGWYEEVAVKVV